MDAINRSFAQHKENFCKTLNLLNRNIRVINEADEIHIAAMLHFFEISFDTNSI
ncbi:MAG: hypothetical protein FWE44_04130 [Defluviitaleaceae bacterium]|nr:hypothetical protein [Defluviitaleaceae bacterium]